MSVEIYTSPEEFYILGAGGTGNTTGQCKLYSNDAAELVVYIKWDLGTNNVVAKENGEDVCGLCLHSQITNDTYQNFTPSVGNDLEITKVEQASDRTWHSHPQNQVGDDGNSGTISHTYLVKTKGNPSDGTRIELMAYVKLEKYYQNDESSEEPKQNIYIASSTNVTDVLPNISTDQYVILFIEDSPALTYTTLDGAISEYATGGASYTDGQVVQLGLKYVDNTAATWKKSQHFMYNSSGSQYETPYTNWELSPASSDDIYAFMRLVDRSGNARLLCRGIAHGGLDSGSIEDQCSSSGNVKYGFSFPNTPGTFAWYYLDTDTNVLDSIDQTSSMNNYYQVQMWDVFGSWVKCKITVRVERGEDGYDWSPSYMGYTAQVEGTSHAATAKQGNPLSFLAKAVRCNIS